LEIVGANPSLGLAHNGGWNHAAINTPTAMPTTKTITAIIVRNGANVSSSSVMAASLARERNGGTGCGHACCMADLWDATPWDKMPECRYTYLIHVVLTRSNSGKSRAKSCLPGSCLIDALPFLIIPNLIAPLFELAPLKKGKIKRANEKSNGEMVSEF
jgi:hypothetical protein